MAMVFFGGYGFTSKNRLEQVCELAVDYAQRHGVELQPKELFEDLLLSSQHDSHRRIQDAIADGLLQGFRTERRDGGRGCVAILTTGERIPFGWRNAVSPKPAHGLLVAYFRQVTEPDITGWRGRWLARHGRDHLICPLTGERVHWKECHVDHVDPTFKQLVADFETQYLEGIDLTEIRYESTKKPGVRRIGEEWQWIADEFIRFHAAKTECRRVDTPRLRLVKAEANLSRRAA